MESWSRIAELFFMVALDYTVLVGYFLLMIGIGVYASLKIKAQEDFFMGGRSFGKLLQTFAAFGAGTGSSDPANVGRTTYTSGMSGMWSVMYWLFVTPFYWIAGVWYRRMRHLTLGDWFVERYESKALGAGYAVFGILFYMVYGSMLFSAIGKVAAPLVDFDSFMWNGQVYRIEYLLVPIIGVVVLLYGILGGLRAAYLTDLVQGMCIIVLSVMLIPYGLHALVEKFGDPSSDGLLDGFRIMHTQLPPESFTIVGATSSSEFPLHRIIAIVIINLIGIVVQPHFIATGGGSAKNETDARVGLVVGNFLKRFCAVGWVLTALIAVALFADDPEIAADPDLTWGVASRELLPAGLTGLMLACLLAALMSSVDAYMIVGSGLLVRNVYAPYFNAHATEKEYIRLARITGILVVGGAVILSMMTMDVFLQLQLTWVFNILFAAPFWVGMYWRRATKTAAWLTVAYCALVFFFIPYFAPRWMPELRLNQALVQTNDVVVITTERPAAPSDVKKREGEMIVWDETQARLQAARESFRAALSAIQEKQAAEQPPTMVELKRLEEAVQRLAKAEEDAGNLSAQRPEAIEAGATITDTVRTGGNAIFWTAGVTPIDEQGAPRPELTRQPVGEPNQLDERTTQVVLRYPEGTRLQGNGNFQLDFLLYKFVGLDMTSMTNATLDTLSLPPKIITPFLVMILLSLISRPNNKSALDRYYIKMKTPVLPNHDEDVRNLEAAYAEPEKIETKKLFPGTSLEFSKPTRTDVIGVVISIFVCFVVIGLTILVATIGS
jgi:solute:Na+ symporter, SSS family